MLALKRVVVRYAKLFDGHEPGCTRGRSVGDQRRCPLRDGEDTFGRRAMLGGRMLRGER
jgi:hypothetical protein